MGFEEEERKGGGSWREVEVWRIVFHNGNVLNILNANIKKPRRESSDRSNLTYMVGKKYVFHCRRTDEIIGANTSGNV